MIRAVKKAGYEAFNARYSTDHRSYYVDLSAELLFRIQIQPLSKFEPRMLQSSNRVQVTEYIRTKHRYLSAHNFFKRLQQLEQPGHRHRFAERLDKDIEAASLAAEQAIPRFDKPMWSIELAQARKREQVLRKCLSMVRTRLRNQDQIQNEWSEVAPPEDLPEAVRDCKVLLKRQRSTLKNW